MPDAYMLRPAQAADIPELKRLWRASFAEDAQGPFVDWYFRRRFQPENCWLLAENGPNNPDSNIVAMCHAPLTEMQLADGDRLPIPYIQGVATAAEYRRQGLCRRLLAGVEAELARRGHSFCLLKPFDPAFYQPLGYQFCTYLRRYELDFNQHFLSKLPPWQPDFQRLYYLPQAADWPEAAATAAAEVYRLWCGQTGGPGAFACRTPREMALLLADHRQDGGQLLLAQRAAGQPLAYALFTATPAGLFIRELAFSQREWAEQLLCALAADYREDTPAAVIITPDNAACAAPLPETLAGWQVLPFAMLKPLTKSAPECYNIMKGAHFYEYF